MNPGVNLGDIGNREKPMKTREPYIRLCFLGAMILAVLVCVNAGVSRQSVVLGAPGGIPDQGQLEVQRNEKLDEVNANLRELNAKIEALLGLLKSGKLVVVTAEGGAKPVGGSPGKAEQGR